MRDSRQTLTAAVSLAAFTLAGTPSAYATTHKFALTGGPTIELQHNFVGTERIAFAFGWATPFADSEIVVQTGGAASAKARDLDGPTAPPIDWHLGTCSAAIGLIYNTIEPKLNSFGSYYNLARIFEDGKVSTEPAAGTPPPVAPANTIIVDMTSFGLVSETWRVNITAGTSTTVTPTGRSPETRYQAVVVGGAEFDPLSGTFSASSLPSSGGPAGVASAYAYEDLEQGLPSIHRLAAEAEADAAQDISGDIVAALNDALRVGRGGGWSLDATSVEVELDSPVDLYDAEGDQLDWYLSVVEEANDVTAGPPVGCCVLPGGGKTVTTREDCEEGLGAQYVGDYTECPTAVTQASWGSIKASYR